MKIITELEIIVSMQHQILKTNVKRYVWCAVSKENNFTIYLSSELNTGEVQLVAAINNSHLELKLVNVEISNHASTFVKNK